MAKKQTLTAALAETPAQEPITETTPRAETAPHAAVPRPDRAGKTNITGYFDRGPGAGHLAGLTGRPN